MPVKWDLSRVNAVALRTFLDEQGLTCTWRHGTCVVVPSRGESTAEKPKVPAADQKLNKRKRGYWAPIKN